MALITKMHRCAFCGSSEVVVSENGTYTCKDCGKVADHGMLAFFGVAAAALASAVWAGIVSKINGGH